jgi:hypothetical protein
MKVNGEAMNGRYDLKAGDVLSVGGLTLQFRIAETEQEHAAPANAAPSTAATPPATDAA